jgi:hypothetical protein
MASGLSCGFEQAEMKENKIRTTRCKKKLVISGIILVRAKNMDFLPDNSW